MEITAPVFELDGHCDERSIFLLQLSFEVAEEALPTLRQAWVRAWQQAGRAAPGLMILDCKSTLTTLTGEELRAAGLVRLN